MLNANRHHLPQGRVICQREQVFGQMAIPLRATYYQQYLINVHRQVPVKQLNAIKSTNL